MGPSCKQGQHTIQLWARGAVVANVSFFGPRRGSIFAFRGGVCAAFHNSRQVVATFRCCVFQPYAAAGAEGGALVQLAQQR
eukprot:1828959-Lingulodinium_polyedra.AAC.1